MTILGIETSCDETGAAVIQVNPKTNEIKIISNILASSLSLHSKTGGIIPEIAAREQVKYMIPVLEKSLKEFDKNTKTSIDAIAVTVGPGLVGSLLVGVETARTLSYLWDKPIIPVNHLIGHIYANWLTDYGLQSTEKQKAVVGSLKAISKQPEFPQVALVVSGGHTDLVLLKDHNKLKWLGGTRDDAAGEAFDKIGRLLDLPYPGGPSIEKEALKGNPKKFTFPKPMIDSKDFDFSFSGLKAAVFREIKSIKKIDKQIVSDISYAVQEAIIDVLVKKTLKAAEKYKVRSILLGGGVAANNKLKEKFQSSIVNGKSSIKLFVPTKSLCTDNAAMIATAAFYNYKPVAWQNIKADPELYFY
ncbi:MAG: tRNA (adenosine(37)-N6)-threonylcarbamoyltransferase complex transferase subunit TsaD [Patescibacteria group bacterium]